MINLDDKLLEILNGNELYVFMNILKRINKDGESWPSIFLLKKETGFGEEKLRKAIKGCVDKKVLSRKQKIEKGRYSHTIYKITTDLCGVYINLKNKEICFIDDDETISNGRIHDTDARKPEKQTLSINNNLSINHIKEYCPEKKLDVEFYNSIIKYFPERVIPDTIPKAEKWLKDIRLIREKDNYTLEKIKEIVVTFRNDDFWKGNFMSFLKLRTTNKHGIKYVDYFNENLKSIKEHKTIKGSNRITREQMERKKKDPNRMKI